MYPHLLKEIIHLFAIYKDPEGKRVEVKGWRDAAYARDRVTRPVKSFTGGKAAKNHESGKKSKG
jgi:inorganic pyrophosphatase